MRDYSEILNSMRICLNVDRDSNCLSECFGCKYITHDHHVMDMVRDAADAIEELLAERTAFWVDTQPHLDDSSYKKDGMAYYCSNCHHRAGKYKHRSYKFCPWCGARIVPKDTAVADMLPPLQNGENKADLIEQMERFQEYAKGGSK